MKKQNLMIRHIPAILWGEPADRLFIAVHGDQSNKTDNVIVMLAEEATAKGYQVLSFDLPEHGDRKDSPEPCKVQNCVSDLRTVMQYVRGIASDISLFAVSVGAYFSLLAYRDVPLKQALFLSPVVDMRRLIENMMTWFGISEEKLKAQLEIPTPIGKTLYWDYYSYVKTHPVDKWSTPTAILYGEKDTLSEYDRVAAFSGRFGCNMTVMEDGEHYFHTDEQLAFLRNWLKETGLKKLL